MEQLIKINVDFTWRCNKLSGNVDFFSPWIFTISNPLSHDSAALQHACSLTKAKFPEQKSCSLPHQATDERVHDLGKGREEKNSESLSRHAQLEHLKNTR